MIILDYKDTRPIYEQVVEKLETLILKGVLEPDSQLPSVRSLAAELSINPNTIQRAYTELERQGFIYTVKGRGGFRTLRRKPDGNQDGAAETADMGHPERGGGTEHTAEGTAGERYGRGPDDAGIEEKWEND